MGLKEFIQGMHATGEKIVEQEAKMFSLDKTNPSDVNNLVDRAHEIGGLTGLGREDTVPRSLVRGAEAANGAKNSRVRGFILRRGSSQSEDD